MAANTEPSEMTELAKLSVKIKEAYLTHPVPDDCAENIESAFELLGYLHHHADKRWTVDSSSLSKHSEKYLVKIWPNASGQFAIGVSACLPEAICLAALQVVNHA